MGSRTALQTLLETVLGSQNVYFQPPISVKLQYPCIVYERSSIDTKFADNNPYTNKRRYSVTLVDKNPDSAILDKLIGLPRCSYEQHYTADNLNHDSYSIYY